MDTMSLLKEKAMEKVNADLREIWRKAEKSGCDIRKGIAIACREAMNPDNYATFNKASSVKDLAERLEKAVAVDATTTAVMVALAKGWRFSASAYDFVDDIKKAKIAEDGFISSAPVAGMIIEALR